MVIRFFPVVAALALLLAACAPRAGTPVATGPVATSPVATGPAAPDGRSGQERLAERTATVAFHRMEIGRLESGAYNTNVLIDLVLPSGVRWTIEDFSDGGYSLIFTSDEVPGVSWRVSPAGVDRLASG